MATRHKEFASLCRKVMAMKQKVVDKRSARTTVNAVPAQGSVEETAVGPVRRPPVDSALRTAV